MSIRLENKIARAIYYFDDDEMEIAVRLAKRIVKAVEQSMSRRTKRATDGLRRPPKSKGLAKNARR